MKKFMFLAVTLLIALGACQKEEISPVQDEASSTVTKPDTSASTGGSKGSMTEYVVNPKFGKPSSTYYYFKVYDASGSLSLSVRLYDKASGTTTYLPMSKSGSYWTLSTRIVTNGWYDYRYVYSGTQTSISSKIYQLCNSRNSLNVSSINSITWPFGADGSSWNNRTVYINGSAQSWSGGQETNGVNGNGWGQGYHTGTDEKYSDDWNRGVLNQDFGAEIRSPLDGYIADYGTYTTSLGSSKYVAIVQEIDGKQYRFYVGHLNAIESSLYVGKYVRAGVTKIGTLGKSGASSPHAHTSLRDVTNGAIISVPFYFNAQ